MRLPCPCGGKERTGHTVPLCITQRDAMRLILLRHAKTEKAEGGMRDRERALNARGEHDAPLIGAYIAHHELLPDLALVPTAARARPPPRSPTRSVSTTRRRRRSWRWSRKPAPRCARCSCSATIPACTRPRAY